ncbi:MAG: hypothetical protein KGL48_12260 [Sphingomonadales bacterium]|nr:hypothetical protein [Sphingomonadales bacterium]MDE2569617.1 hypothetical protein [Sphingomonadales bacterium]
MMTTAGDWQASPLARSTSSWPFDWVCEITTIDPATRSHRYVATIRQSGARPMAEALANVRAMARAPAMLALLSAISAVIDMSDPAHPDFADSAADCLDALLVQEEPLRALLVEVANDVGALTP